MSKQERHSNGDGNQGQTFTGEWAFLGPWAKALGFKLPSLEFSSGSPAGAEGGSERSERPTGAEAVPDLLEQEPKDCGRTAAAVAESETIYEVRKCRCSSWFCPDCCEGKGIAVRERLRPVLETFTGVMMWTFTIDPTLFANAEEAFMYVRRNRCLSELMRTLKKRGYLHTTRYFYVVEFQKETGQAHWHLLLDATYIPKEVVQDIWDRFRPRWAGPKPEDRPGLGMVRYSAPKFEQKSHAANYATKYLIKVPENGYPEWVLDFEGQIRRYDVSRGFWPQDEASEDEGKEALSYEELARYYGEEADPEGCDEPSETAPRTIRERVADCGRQTVLIGRQIVTHEDGSQESKVIFEGKLDFLSHGDVKEFLGFEKFDMRAFPITAEDMRRLKVENARRKLAFYMSCIGVEERFKTLGDYEHERGYWYASEEEEEVLSAIV